jgi:hypothetical protein
MHKIQGVRCRRGYSERAIRAAKRPPLGGDQRDRSAAAWEGARLPAKCDTKILTPQSAGVISTGLTKGTVRIRARSSSSLAQSETEERHFAEGFHVERTQHAQST